MMGRQGIEAPLLGQDRQAIRKRWLRALLLLFQFIAIACCELSLSLSLSLWFDLILFSPLVYQLIG